MLAFVDGVYLKDGVEVPPHQKISIYTVMSVPMIITGFLMR